jgi:hypothetical protein
MKMPLSICLIRLKKNKYQTGASTPICKKYRLINFLAAEQALQTLFEPAVLLK